MTSYTWPRKDPDEILDYSLDWSTILETGETLSTVTWTVPSGLTKISDSEASGVTTIWLSGGTSGTLYELGIRVITSASRTYDLTVRLPVVTR